MRLLVCLVAALLLIACDGSGEAPGFNSPPASNGDSTKPAEKADQVEKPVFQVWSSYAVPSHSRRSREDWLAWRRQAQEDRLKAHPADTATATLVDGHVLLRFSEAFLDEPAGVTGLKFSYIWESQADLSRRMNREDTELDYDGPIVTADRSGAAIVPIPDDSQEYHLHIILRDDRRWVALPLPGPNNLAQLGTFMCTFRDDTVRERHLNVVWWE